MKQNYLKGFDGVMSLLSKLQRLVQRCDKELTELLEANEIQFFHFAFRWLFCLLLREFPADLAIVLLDYYLVEDLPPDELSVYLAAALLLRFSRHVKVLEREEMVSFMQNLPTSGWGEQDIRLMVSEAFTLRSLFSEIT